MIGIGEFRSKSLSPQNLHREIHSPGVLRENNDHNHSVYDFTFDPNEEPPQKKCKSALKKAKPKPKVVYINNNYDNNISKTLENLKAAVKRKSSDCNISSPNENVQQYDKENNTPVSNVQNNNSSSTADKLPNQNIKHSIQNLKESHYISPMHKLGKVENKLKSNTSENMSVHKSPSITKSSQASPWRAEFDTLPLKWQHNTHVKPNITPSQTSVVISAEKKMLGPGDLANGKRVLPQMFGEEIDGTKLKQSSILSFIKDKNNANKVSSSPHTNEEPKLKVLEGEKNNGPLLNENAENIPLFEDIDVVHHVKPSRRSYGKPKKLSFGKHTESHKHIVPPNNEETKTDYEESIPFMLPVAKIRQPAQKKVMKLTKKEEEEVEAWASVFNSMCDEVEEFPLTVE